MSDKTELNPEFSDKQNPVESVLRGLELPKTAVDHDSIMYQAGWAAAMAELNSDRHIARNTNRVSRFWPAMAITFAATTAACLFAMLSPSLIDGEPTQVASADPVSKSQAVEPPSDSSDRAATENELTDASETQFKSTSNQFKVPSLFGRAVDRIVGERNAQIQRYVAEAAAPTRSVPIGLGIDWDIEPSAPLTPQSIRSSSL